MTVVTDIFTAKACARSGSETFASGNIWFVSRDTERVYPAPRYTKYIYAKCEQQSTFSYLEHCFRSRTISSTIH